MKYMMIIFAMLMAAGASATLVLDNIQFDPAIIAAGDEVDIVIQYHHKPIGEDDDKIGNPEYTFGVKIEPDDTLTQEYVTIQDAVGDDVSIYANGYYNKRFRVKVAPNAVAGNYEFKLSGQWYHNGEAEPTFQYVRFTMPVKKEGIILDIASFNTVPAEVRPGDNFVKIESYVENVGEKDAKSVEVQLRLPEGLESSYSNNNRIWVGRADAGESKQAVFYIDVDEMAQDSVYSLQFDMQYMDTDDNRYQKTVTVPFLVKPRPYLEVVKSEGGGMAGTDGKLLLTVKNTGSESAEAVDVRILLQNSQPFTMDLRSDYIGELEPGEEGLAVFDLKATREAEEKEHLFKVLIRSKGDSDEGDDNIYTYNRRASYTIRGEAPNRVRDYGLMAGGVVVLFIVGNFIYRRKK